MIGAVKIVCLSERIYIWPLQEALGCCSEEVSD
jgi:hypothetical protein